ncbi:MAG: hypothetical protein WAP74_00565 [Patescibacteria group bacterium]
MATKQTKTKSPSKTQTKIEKQNTAPKVELDRVRQLLDSAENQIRQARALLFGGLYGEKAKQLHQKEGDEAKVIEGVFDGEMMVASGGKRYPVPPNYASKSKLVPGDILKLTVGGDGTFIYKQIGPVDRKKLIGKLEESGGRYEVVASGKRYSVLLASVTYFRARPGDELTIVVPRNEESTFAALENVISAKH